MLSFWGSRSWGPLALVAAAGQALPLPAASQIVLAGTGPFLPVFNSRESPRVPAAVAVAGAGRPYGLALAADGGGSPVGPLATDRCALLTHDRDLAGQVAVRDAAGVVAAMTI
jgi:hypothetical protein